MQVKSSLQAQLDTWEALQNKNLVHEEVTSPMAQDWLQEFSRLTEWQLQKGLRKVARFSGFFNQAAFIGLCLQTSPEDVGAPSADEAYLESCRNAGAMHSASWSHPAVFHAAADTGIHALRVAGYQGETRRTFDDAYHERIRQAEGNVLPPIPEVELIPEKPAGRPMTPAERKQAMAKLREKVGI